MNSTIKLERENILNEMDNHRSSYYEYLRLENELDKLKRKCKHENAYWNGQETDSYEGRTYDQIMCPDCFEEWEERCICGNHKYQSLSKYLEKINVQ